MTREELINSNEYKLANASLDYWRRNGEKEGLDDAFCEGAKWAKERMIDKVCEWLFKNFYHEETMVDCIAYKHEDEDVNVMIEHFKQAMEE